MRLSLAYGIAVVLALASSACSGGRTERIACTDISQCEPGVCLRGYCTDIDLAQVSAVVTPVGAPAEVFIVDAEGQSCEARTCTELRHGTRVTFRASAVAGFRFAGWSGSPECTGNALELVIPSLTIDTECFANYVRRARVSGVVTGIEGGVSATTDAPFASCSGNSCEVDADSSVTLTANERFGERFLGWTGEGCTDSGTLTVTVRPGDRDVVCQASFRPRVTVGGRTMNIESAVVVTTSDLNPVCEPGACVVDAGSSVTLAAPISRGFRFAGWSGSTACSGMDNPLVLSEVAEPQLCVATYVPRVQVRGGAAGALPLPAVLAESSDSHSVCSGETCEVDKGGAVTLLATSAPGYRLTHWTGPVCEGETGAAVAVANAETDLVCIAQYAPGIAVIGSVVDAPGDVVASSTSPVAMCMGGTCSLIVGADATLTAPQIPGYRFQGWTGDPGCLSAERAVTFTQVMESRTCYARYAARFVARGVAVPMEGGSVLASSTAPDATCNNEACTLDKGGPVLLTAAPKERFRFSGWSGGGACTGSVPALQIAAVESNTSCQANFVGRIAVTGVVTEGMGAVSARSPSGGSACAGATCSLDLGATAVLIAMPAVGYRFDGWSGCAESASATLELPNRRADAECRARFVPLRFTVAGSVAPANSGSVVASSPAASAACTGASCTVDHGASVTLTATAPAGFRFTGWGGCATSAEPSITLASVTGDVSCQANFTRVFVSVSASAAPTGSGSVAAATTAPGGSCAGASCSVPFGSTVTLTATPAPGHRFLGWSGCATGAQNPLSLSALGRDAACQASFERLRFTVSGAAAPALGGSVVASSTASSAECAAASCTVDLGSPVRLTATAAPGFRLTGWSCPGANGAVLNLASVNASASCEARFQLLTYAVNATSTAGGTLTATATGGSCTGTNCQVQHGGSVSFTAVPNAGFSFRGWSGAGCVADPASPLSITLAGVAGPATCRASFGVSTYAVSGVANGGGSVTASTPGGTCPGGTCTVNHGATVTLTAVASAGVNFTGWSAGCTPERTNPLRVVLRAVTEPVTCTANFGVNVYAVSGVATAGTITATATPGSCTGASCQVNHGGSVTFTVTVPLGTTLSGWSPAVCVQDPAQPTRATLANVTGPQTCTANVGVNRYTVSGVPTAGGTITATSAMGTCNEATCQVNHGGTAVLEAKPNANFRFDGWAAGCTADADAPNRVTLGSVTGPVTCNATFSAIQHMVTASAGTGGTVALSAAGALCPGNLCVVQQGSPVTVRAAPAAGFNFSGWSGLGCPASMANPLSFAVAGMTTCTANFTVGSQTVTFVTGQGGTVMGTTTTGTCGPTSCQITNGGSVTLNAMPTAGFRFVGWSGCSTLATPALTLADVAAPQSCTATFAALTHAVVATSNAGGAITANATGGTCTGTSCTISHGGSVTFTATPSVGSTFTGWSANCPTSPTNGRQVVLSNVTEAITCTASFGAQTVLVAGSANNGGTVTGTVGGVACPDATCTAPLGATVTFRAGPDTERARFSHFTGTCRGPIILAGVSRPLEGIPTAAAILPGNPRVATVTASAGATCVANFVPRVFIGVSPDAGDEDPMGLVTVSALGGEPECTVSQCVVDQGTLVTVSAQPRPGFRFRGWINACPLTDFSKATTTIEANANDTCFALFERAPPPVIR